MFHSPNSPPNNLVCFLHYRKHKLNIAMKKVILYGILLLLYRCDLIEYHPYNVRLHGQTGINEKNIARIEESCKGKDTLRFVLMGDSQRWYDETEAFVKALNNRDDVDFVIHGGDISDFGLTKEFLWVRDIMEKLKVPYVALLGNLSLIHICLLYKYIHDVPHLYLQTFYWHMVQVPLRTNQRTPEQVFPPAKAIYNELMTRPQAGSEPVSYTHLLFRV